ncbi:N-6 DNA methylase [uncultured Hydrogenophaga sp.]|uniref:HsdM family class I SAM-dependent methyltransferase n=1 Tax=uncultured Hydrogenophaga sp. TaxID=199683 RepID=UPI00258909D6|nr:N-6 DNA methylase [uncultured Hydrogenophaga sp.]
MAKSKKLSKTSELAAFVQAIRRLGFLEASYWLSSAYAMLADEGHRKQLAMFFTPVSLTRGLLDDLAKQGVDFGAESFIDPACGGAAFLAPIALRMRDELRTKGLSPRAILQHIEGHLFGTDLDATLCALSAHFLRMALRSEIAETGYLPDFKVHQANSLKELDGMHGQLDVCVCNPPYRKMGVEELKPLKQMYGDIVESQPNLYGLFIAQCVKLLREGGRAALVTPTSFLSGQYFSALRRFLSRSSVIEHIGMVSDRLGVFIDVEQETALTVLRRADRPSAGEVWTEVSVVSVSGAYQSVGQIRLPDTGEVWPIPRAVEDVPLLKVAGASPFRLSDYGYRVRIGAFVWNRDKRPTFQCAQDVKRSRCKTAVPLLWSGDISLGGGIRFDAQTAKPDEHRFVDLGSRQHRSVVTRPAVVLQRVTSNTQARRLVAAAVPDALIEQYGGFVGENHLVILEASDETSPVLTPSQMAQLFAAPAVDRYFRCISGATNVSAFELGQLALPNPHQVRQLLLDGLTMPEAVQAVYGLANGHTVI